MIRRLTAAMVLGCVVAMVGCHSRAGDMQRIRELKAQRRVVEKAYLTEVKSRLKGSEDEWSSVDWDIARNETDIHFDYPDQLRSIDARIANINARLDAE